MKLTLDVEEGRERERKQGEVCRVEGGGVLLGEEGGAAFAWEDSLREVGVKVGEGGANSLRVIG